MWIKSYGLCIIVYHIHGFFFVLNGNNIEIDVQETQVYGFILPIILQVFIIPPSLKKVVCLTTLSKVSLQWKNMLLMTHGLELLKYVMHKSALENNISKCQKTKHKAIVTPSTTTSVFWNVRPYKKSHLVQM